MLGGNREIMKRVDRRRFVLAAGALIAARPAIAQRPTDRQRVIGMLIIRSRADAGPEHAAFAEGLREGGFVEGENLRIESRYADYDYRKLDLLAENLVHAKVEVIYAPTPWPAYAAQAATKSIPIVFSGINDPVGNKLVQSLGRPGGNLTGASEANAELTAKRMQLMRELFPGEGRLGVIYDEDSAKACVLELQDIRSAGRQLGVDVLRLPYTEKAELADAFKKARRANVVALLIPTTYETRRYGGELAQQSASSRIPMIHSDSEAVDAGGLMSYGPAREWGGRRAGNYVARVLKGAKPADMPVEQPTRYELVVNLKTAKALGIRIPQSILLRADRVIE